MATLTEFTGEGNHMSPLVQHPPTVHLSRLVNSLKGISSRMLRHDHPAQVRTVLWGKKHFWSRSYFAGSPGGVPLSVVQDYIENQKHLR